MSTSDATWGICECDQEMVPGGACLFTHAENKHGTTVVRKPYGAEAFFAEPGTAIPPTCHDCNVAVGKPHHANCDIERCAFCDMQALMCDHADSYISTSDGWSYRTELVFGTENPIDRMITEEARYTPSSPTTRPDTASDPSPNPEPLKKRPRRAMYDDEYHTSGNHRAPPHSLK